MTYKTELGEYLYYYSPLPKTLIPAEILEDLTSAFCIRNNMDLVEIVEIETNIYLVAVQGEETLDTWVRWADAFYPHGYTPPVLTVETRPVRIVSPD